MMDVKLNKRPKNRFNQKKVCHLVTTDDDYIKTDTVQHKLAWRKGYEEGLKWLVSTNFQDFDPKPAFGVPLPDYKLYDEGESAEERGRKLWGEISKSVLRPC